MFANLNVTTLATHLARDNEDLFTSLRGVQIRLDVYPTPFGFPSAEGPYWNLAYGSDAPAPAPNVIASASTILPGHRAALAQYSDEEVAILADFAALAHKLLVETSVTIH